MSDLLCFADFLSCAYDIKQNPDEVTKFIRPAGDIQEKIRNPNPLPANSDITIDKLSVYDRTISGATPRLFTAPQ